MAHNGGMKHHWIAWIGLCTMGLVACDVADHDFSPEAFDCATIAGRVTDEYNELIVYKLREWDSEGIRGVRLRFSYPSASDPEARTKDTIQCTYPFTLANRSDPERIVELDSVMYGGRYLSKRELQFLNKSPFRPVPIFELAD
ncbi:hypothetical protein V5T82_03345 [Magnetovibrio sp. PR-2]|uniref:hypothetical protein n=1 Tax=Magnetovibrio sp. PR-2 TaxID=3120356 RepID=UPI002FCDE471